jgi:hypothetical protein
MSRLLYCTPTWVAVAVAAPELHSRFSLIPQLSTDILPLVGYGGSMLVESRKNGQFFRGITWWNYLVGSAAATPRRTAELHSPPARSVSLPQVNGQKVTQLSDFLVVGRGIIWWKLQMIPPANYQRPSQRPRHIFRRCQQMASHLAVAPLPRATAPSSPMICRRQPS